MKIKELYIEEYKILKNFNIQFDTNYATTVFIGKNGCGKTTVLECICLIFSKLLNCSDYKNFKSINFGFNFNIIYTLDYDSVITVELSNIKHNKLSVKIDNNIYDNEEKINKYLNTSEKTFSDFIPKNVVIYYAGISSNLYNIYNDYSFQKNKLPLFYFTPENFPAILIALLSFQYGDVPKILKDNFLIESFKEIKITFEKPPFDKNKEPQYKFWTNNDNLLKFIMELYNIFNKFPKIEENRIIITLNKKEQLQKILEFLGTEKKVFENFVLLQENDLLYTIEIILIKNGIEISHSNLSEGELQLLTIIGLRELLATENSLFLLDEPDTYLHPEWQQDFIYEFISKYENYKNYYLITTHSPNILSGLKSEQVKVLESGNLKNITFDTYGKPIDMLLVDFFDLKSLRFKKVDEEIRKLKDLVITEKYDTVEFKDRLKKLEEAIGSDDIELLTIKLEIAKRKKENEKN